MKKSKYTNYFVSIGLIALCAVVLLLVPLLRDSMFGEEAYFHTRWAEDLDNYDKLSYGGRFAAYSSGLSFMLSFNPGVLAYALPFVLGILSLLLFMLLLKEFGIERKELIAAILILSPTFIFTFSTLNKFMFPVFLTLLGVYLMLRKSKVYLLAIPVIAVLPFFNLLLSLMALFLLFLLVAFREKNKRWLYYIILTLTLFVGSLYYGYFIKNAGLERLFFEITQSGVNGKLQQIFSEMGGKFGLSILGTILAAFGIIGNWKNKYSDLFVFFSIFGLIIIMLFRAEALIFLTFFIAIFAGKGFMYLFKRTWESKNFRLFVLFTFVCGLLFSTVSNTSRLVESLPDDVIIEGMEFLEKQPDAVVFSDPSRGFWISHAEKTTFMDSNFLFAPDVNERWDDMQKMLYTRDWKLVKEMINKYGIEYVWVDKEMKDNLWIDEQEGLLFLLEYSTAFKKVYDNQDMHEDNWVKIWKVSEEEQS